MPLDYWHKCNISKIDTSRGIATGVYRYIYPPKISPWKLFCALIAANVVRLLVYITVVSSCSKNYTHPKWISGYAPGHQDRLFKLVKSFKSPGCRGFALDPLGRTYSTPADPLYLVGRGTSSPQDPHPSAPFELRSSALWSSPFPWIHTLL